MKELQSKVNMLISSSLPASVDRDEENLHSNEIEQLRDTIKSQDSVITKLKEERDSLLTALSLVMTDKRDISQPSCLSTSEMKPKAHESEDTSQEDGSLGNDDGWTKVDRKNTKKKKASKSKHSIPNQSKESGPADKSMNVSGKTTTIIVGDSIIKHLQGKRMSKSSNVKVRAFNGSTVEAMTHYIKPSLEEKPDQLILHVGTNNIQSSSPTKLAEDIIQLANSAKKSLPECSIAISSLTVRSDRPNNKSNVIKTNEHLAKLCKRSKFLEFIDNSDVDQSCLNEGGLHLNRKGTSVLAKNLIQFINKDN